MNIFLRTKEELSYFAPQGSNNLNIYLAKDSRLRFFTFTFGANSVKNNVNVIFEEAGAKAELYGLYFTSSEQVVENNTFLHHKAPFGESFQQYYGILSGKSQAVFNGRIKVERAAQKTQARLESKNILLSKGAKLLGRPFLEIFADDITCTHAFASYQLEDDEIFYLRSRGITQEKAKQILLLGFAQRIINKIDNKEIRNKLCAKISQFLNGKSEARN